MEREFLHYYPHADLTKFDISDKYGVSFNYKGMGYDVFKNTPSGPREKYLDLEIEQVISEALRPRIAYIKKPVVKKVTVIQEKSLPNFPKAYLLNNNANYPKGWNYNSPGSLSITRDLKIRASPTESFTTSIPNIFRWYDTTNSVKAKAFLKGPNFSFWAQQLNFCVWCATTGCGVAYDMLTGPAGSVLCFHVAFTVRRLLYEMSIPTPDVDGFHDYPNTYDVRAYKRIKKEFKAGDDYRIGTGNNNHLGLLHHYDHGILKATALTQYPGIYKFKDEGGDVLFAHNFIEGSQWEHFVLPKGQGLTLAGLARINRSIEAFVYCILGSQVVTRSPIIGATGFAIETQQEFLLMFIGAIKENSIEKGIARYQLAFDLSRARLDYAIAPGCWLMPSNMVINTQTVPGYNNKLQTATNNMKFGVNNINNNRFLGIPSFVESSKKHIGSLKLEDDFKIKSLKDYFGEAKKEKTILPKEKTILPKTKTMLPKTKTMLPETTTPSQDDHTLQKIGLSTAAIALGYYIIR